MARFDASLQGGRNTAPLDERQVNRVVTIFYNLDREANVRFDPQSRTLFRALPAGQESAHEIVFGPDIYPGAAVADPNSILSVKSAAAHELAHKARNENLTEINELELEDIDEAMTSLTAILNFFDHLSAQEIRELVLDANQRLSLYVHQYRDEVDVAE